MGAEVLNGDWRATLSRWYPDIAVNAPAEGRLAPDFSALLSCGTAYSATTQTLLARPVLAMAKASSALSRGGLWVTIRSRCRPQRAALKQRSSMWETVVTQEDRTVSCLKSISSSTSISEIIICGQPARLTEACCCPLGENRKEVLAWDAGQESSIYEINTSVWINERTQKLRCAPQCNERGLGHKHTIAECCGRTLVYEPDPQKVLRHFHGRQFVFSKGLKSAERSGKLSIINV